MFLLDTSYLEVRNTQRKGKGVFAKKTIPSRTIIGDYVGQLVDLANFDFDKEKENQYLMHYNDTHGIYPDLYQEGVHLLNHSCSPNCFIYSLKDHTLVFALRDIKKGEELTISYLLPPKNNCVNCNHACYCSSPNCTNTMHLSEEKYSSWQVFPRGNKVNSKKTNNSKQLKPLTTYPKFVPKKYIDAIIESKVIY